MRLLSLAVLLVGCSTYQITPLRFRTMQPADSFDRASVSMETHAGGIRSSDRKRGIIQSPWIKGSELRASFYQFVVVIMPNAADNSAAVTVKMRVVRCNLATKFSDDKARWCDANADPTGTEVDAFLKFRSAFRSDVFRGDGKSSGS